MSNISWLRSNWFFLTIILAGLCLRLLWVTDMEWKYDEQWMYTHTEEAAQKGQWFTVGMESSGGLVNPGLSADIFVAIAKFVHTPTGMASVVQWINVIAILLFLLFIIYKVDVGQRDIWLWGLTLASVSPLAVLFSRKIWEQDVLPIFCFAVIWANANRSKRWGAFLWGLFGALIGQIHMSGFFYAAGLFIFTVVYDYKSKTPFKWGYWIAGGLVGSGGLIPWIGYVLSHPGASNLDISHVFQFNFYIYWFLDGHGLNTMYSLRKDFWGFIKEPYIGGQATYLVAVLHLLLAATGLYTLKRVIGFVKQLITYYKQKVLFKKLTTNLNITNFYLLGLLLGLGVLLNFCGTFVFQHYLIVAFPFTYIFMAKIFQEKKRLFMAIIFLQLLLTTSLMLYIHTHDGAKNGDYGVTYSAQQK